jgi:hypothetical protein
MEYSKWFLKCPQLFSGANFINKKDQIVTEISDAEYFYSEQEAKNKLSELSKCMPYLSILGSWRVVQFRDNYEVGDDVEANIRTILDRK